MKVALVARDFAPSSAFELLAQELAKEGYSAISLLGRGKPLVASTEEIKTAVRNSDVVVVGMSSSRELAEPELVACEEAVQKRIPFGFYGDTYHCHQRARDGTWFAPYRDATNFFFAINEEETRAARGVFPNARVIAAGNPIWETFAFPKYTREEVRAKLEVKDDEILTLSPGGKSPVINILIWGLLTEALSRPRRDGRKFQVVLACHPGDQAPPEIYGDLVKFSPVPVRFADKDTKTSELLPGIDLLVEWASTIGIEAAHLRKPIVSVATEIGRGRWALTSGTREWELSILGVTDEVGAQSADLADAISALCTPGEAVTKMLQRQEEVYPAAPEKGTAVRKMIEVLEDFRR